MNYSLEMRNEQLGLVDQDNLDMAPVVIDFVSGKTAYRRKYGHVGGEAISKAVGIKKGHRPNVVDATAGWGRDAFVLVSLIVTVSPGPPTKLCFLPSTSITCRLPV